MSKTYSDLPSPSAALRAAIERQQRELRSISRAIGKNSIARDLDRRLRTAGFSSIARDLKRMQRTIGGSSIPRDLDRMQRFATVHASFRGIGRIGLTLSETNVVRDYRPIAEAIQAQGQRALRAQRLLSRSPILEALEDIKRTTELYQRQCESIARATGGAVFAKDIRGISESGGNAPASGLSDKQKASPSVTKDVEATPGPPHAVGFVSQEAHVEWKITVFLAKLPAYFEPLEDPPPKHRMH